MASKCNKSKPLVLGKSELVNCIAERQPQLLEQDVVLAMNSMLERMSTALALGERIEIRGFGSLSLRYRAPRRARNPKTGVAVWVPEKYVPCFKPSRGLRNRVDNSTKVKK